MSRPFGRRKKYGGVAVADLDGDGYDDLLCGHHDDHSMQVYFYNPASASFKVAPFYFYRDIHAITPLRIAPSDVGMHFLVSLGGFKGQRPNHPVLFKVIEDRTIVDVTRQYPELMSVRRRGRSAVVMSLRRMPGNVYNTGPGGGTGGMSGSNSNGGSGGNGRDSGSSGNGGNKKKDGLKEKSVRKSNSSSSRTLTRRGIPELLLLNRRDDTFDQNKVFSIRRPRRPSSSFSSSAERKAPSANAPATMVSMEHLRGRAIRAAPSEYGGVIDIDGDNVLELLLLTDLSLWRVDSYLKLSNITSTAIRGFDFKPAEIRHNGLYTGANAFVALDYDNDGDWDMYVTLSATGHRSWVFWHVHDALFRNDGKGVYDNVIEDSGIPLFPAQSRGVTAADFDNDGWIDIFVTRYKAEDVLLRNNQGDGTFTPVWNIGFAKDGMETRGDMALATDYDRDGGVDLIVSEGSWDLRKHGGYYRVLRNTWRTGNSFLLVRVKSAPGGKATSLHALVKVSVKLEGGWEKRGRTRTLMRRVESPGTMVSNSYVETVHFGLGRASRVGRVWVTWMDGSTASKTGVKVNGTIVFGR